MPNLRAPTSKEIVLDPVRANHGVEVWYRRQLEFLVGQMNRSVLHWLPAAWKKAPPRVIAKDNALRVFTVSGDVDLEALQLAMDAPSSVVLLQRAMARMSRYWQKRFNDASRELSEKFADKAQEHTDLSMMAVLKKAGFTVRFVNTPLRAQVFDAVVAENVGLIKSIPAQYFRDVEQAVWASVSQGRDLQQLTDTIMEKYGIASRRAQFIARDQNNKAKAHMEAARRAKLGIKEANWMHSHGGRKPRPEHVAFDGKRYTIAKGAYLENKWVWPGTEPNCRCTDRGIIPGFDD